MNVRLQFVLFLIVCLGSVKQGSSIGCFTCRSMGKYDTVAQAAYDTMSKLKNGSVFGQEMKQNACEKGGGSGDFRQTCWSGSPDKLTRGKYCVKAVVNKTVAENKAYPWPLIVRGCTDVEPSSTPCPTTEVELFGEKLRGCFYYCNNTDFCNFTPAARGSYALSIAAVFTSLHFFALVRG